MVLNALTTCTLAGVALAISCAAEVSSGVTSPVAPELKVLLMSTMTISPAGTSPVVPAAAPRPSAAAGWSHNISIARGRTQWRVWTRGNCVRELASWALRRGTLLCQFGLTQSGCQSILTAVDLEELSVNLSSDDPAVGLRASLALHRLAERVEANQVAAAREKGWSWQQIGDALGITRQSVHAKYNKESS
jgi:hypothetical protein